MAAVERLVQRVSSTRTFAKVAPHVVPALDRAVHRLTGGKVLLSTRMLPSCLLTSTGAKSGLPRRTPLACMPLRGTGDAGGAGPKDDAGLKDAAGPRNGIGGTDLKGAAESAWVLIGSNFGRPGHPAWTANLLAHPDAEISWRGRDVAVRARLLRGAEREAVWAAVVRFWPPYARYQARVEREIRLFRLERRSDRTREGDGGRGT